MANEEIMQLTDRIVSQLSPLHAVLCAREALRDATPLLRDCGRYCGAACCQGDENTGMLLFPGEEELYRGCAFGRVVPARYRLAGRRARLFVCRGECPREQRPLSCRLFPARILPEGEIAMDSRAAPVCPIFSSGNAAFSPAFRKALNQAAEALLSDEVCRAFLRDLDRQLRL